MIQSLIQVPDGYILDTATVTDDFLHGSVRIPGGAIKYFAVQRPVEFTVAFWEDFWEQIRYFK